MDSIIENDLALDEYLKWREEARRAGETGPERKMATSHDEVISF